MPPVHDSSSKAKGVARNATSMKNRMNCTAPNLHYLDLVHAFTAQGEGRVSPNPLVGMVIVKDGNVVSHCNPWTTLAFGFLLLQVF
jgi:hypothetical protein